MSPAAPVPVLGWKEQVHLPDWGLQRRGKLDTGARSSALHVTEMEELGDRFDPVSGHHLPVVRFDVVLGTRAAPRHHEVEAVIVAHRRVRDTGARAELRPVVHVALPGDRASAEDDPSDEEDDDDPDVAES